MNPGSKILVAPLDWGLGHASRCVPVIRFLLNNGMIVLLGGSGSSLAYLRRRFPELESVELPSARMQYGRGGMVSFRFLASMFCFAFNIPREHRALERIIAEHSIDYVFSDNRLGLYSNSAISFYMTHQLRFDSGYMNRFVAWLMRRLHSHYIIKYRCCFVPDAEGKLSLSGMLSKSDLKTKYLGPLSRFAGEQECNDGRGDFDLLILSGVEPQRTTLENIFIEKYSAMPGHRLHIIRGVSGTEELDVPEFITYENDPADERIAMLVWSARRVFCRSGYSSLCDLAALGRRAVLVPTPKQPEQEYLAEYFSRTFGFVTCSQEKLPELNFSDISFDGNWNYNYFCNLNEILK